MTLSFHTHAERAELADSADEIVAVWPEFMLWDPIANLYFSHHLERHPEFVFYAVDEEDPDVVLARGFSVPFAMELDDGRRATLPDSGWDRVVMWATADHQAGRTPNVVSALEISVRPGYLGRGISAQMVATMRANARRMGFSTLVAPVRPNAKHLEPDTPMSEYAFRTRSDGLPADPWLRVHVRLGGRIESVASCSMTIPGTLAEWRTWTGLPVDRSGDLTVPGALVPVHVDVEHDHAVYVEPNVWVRHDL